MKIKNILYLLAFFAFFAVAGIARAGVPTVVSAEFTTSSNFNKITIVYSEAVYTAVLDYTDLNLSSVQCGNWTSTITDLVGDGTDTIILTFANPCTTDPTGTIDITGVTSVLTLESIIPINDQPILDKQNPATFFGCGDTNSSPSSIWVYFSEDVDNFIISDIGLVTNGTVTGFFLVAPDWLYQVLITPTTEGVVTVDVAGGVADDQSPADNPNNAATQCSFNYDITLPTLVSAEITGPDTVTVIYSEQVWSDSVDYENFGGDLAGRNITSIDTNGPSTTFNLTFDGAPMGTSATGTMDIQNNWGVWDSAGNSLVSPLGQIVSDGQVPVLMSAVTVDVFTIDVTFSEDLDGRTPSNNDFEVDGYTLDPANEADEITPGVVRLTTLVPFGAGEVPDVTYNTIVSSGVTELLSAGGKTAPDAVVTPDDGIVPTVMVLGDGVSYFTIPAGTTADLIFGEPLSATGKTNVETAVLAGANQIITFGWDGTDAILTITGHATNLTTFTSDVTADVEDANGTMSPGLQLIDSIGDTTPPVITLNGSGSITIEFGTTYGDAGATALDDVDGDLTSSIATNNPVNTNVSGTYTVTYNVSDTAGNPATQITRSVTVNQQPGGVVLIPSPPPAPIIPTAVALPTIPTVLGATTTRCAPGDLYNGATGKPCAVTGQVLGASTFNFTQTLKSGSRGDEVKELQKFLNTDSDTQVATSGAGSPGNETSYFGAKTKTAVIKFQNKYKSEVLTPIGLISGTGLFGAMSRAKANKLAL